MIFESYTLYKYLFQIESTINDTGGYKHKYVSGLPRYQSWVLRWVLFKIGNPITWVGAKLSIVLTNYYCVVYNFVTSHRKS